MESSAKTGNNVEEIFAVLTETILGKIEEQQVEPRNHPGVKIGNEKYLGVKEDYLSQTEKEDKVIIENIKNRSSQKKKGCCK
jgi:hypothetical protein